MLALNLGLSPSLSFNKSNYHRLYPINGSLLLHPSLLVRASSSSGQNAESSKVSRFHTDPLGLISSKRRSQIQDPCTIGHGFPLNDAIGIGRVCSNLRFHTWSSRARSTVSGGGDEEADSKKRQSRLQLGLVFGFWYFQNIVFNIYNKKVLNVFPFPWFLASFQLFVGSVWMVSLWSLKLQSCPKISKSFLVALLGPALFHTIGHISACVSFSKVAVSFTHVIKSAEPVFTVLFSSILGDSYPFAVWLSILPIVFGCSLAAVTEVSFNFGGLWGAMISNVGFVLRNIYSKRSLQHFKEVNGLNLYGWITIISFVYLFPVAIFVEGSQWLQGYSKAIEAAALGGKSSTFYLWVLLSGVFYHLYNQSSYQALDDISPLTFSVGNTMKRVVVIISTVLVFKNPVRPLNALGSAIAIFGTFLYSQATAKKVAAPKPSDNGSSQTTT